VGSFPNARCGIHCNRDSVAEALPDSTSTESLAFAGPAAGPMAPREGQPPTTPFGSQNLKSSGTSSVFIGMLMAE